MEQSWGKPVQYGQVVQFQHVKSERWLTTESSQTAPLEPENFKITLQEDATTESHFVLKTAAAFLKEVKAW